MPPAYFRPTDEHGIRDDLMQRPELCSGSVEFIAPVEYMVGEGRRLARFNVDTGCHLPSSRHIWASYFSASHSLMSISPASPRSCHALPSWLQVRPPQPPVYVFVLDVSFSAIQSGVLQSAANAIAASLDRLPGDARTQ